MYTPSPSCHSFIICRTPKITGAQTGTLSHPFQVRYCAPHRGQSALSDLEESGQRGRHRALGIGVGTSYFRQHSHMEVQICRGEIRLKKGDQHDRYIGRRVTSERGSEVGQRNPLSSQQLEHVVTNAHSFRHIARREILPENKVITSSKQGRDTTHHNHRLTGCFSFSAAMRR